MKQQTLKARIQLKHATEAEWSLATNFTPLESEMIVYDPDDNYNYPRFKLGDGKTKVGKLPFITSNCVRINTWEDDD